MSLKSPSNATTTTAPTAVAVAEKALPLQIFEQGERLTQEELAKRFHAFLLDNEQGECLTQEELAKRFHAFLLDNKQVLGFQVPTQELTANLLNLTSSFITEQAKLNDLRFANMRFKFVALSH